MSRVIESQVVVIGAGPAGSMAAVEAAAAGLRVNLLERKEHAGLPVRCGEAVGLRGIRENVEVDPRWVRSEIRRMRLISPSGIPVDLDNVDASIVLDREVMDPDLVQRARAAGAGYYPSTPVTAIARENDGRYTCITNQAVFRASCIILADGVESRLARGLGWKTALSLEDVCSCAFARVHCDNDNPDRISIYYGSRVAPGGFAWVFPRGETCANVGLGILGSKSSAKKARENLETFIRIHFPGAPVTDLHCAGVPVGRWLTPLVRDGVMVVGDAARQVNALSGGGITYALASGKTAGRAAARAFENGSLNTGRLKQYEKIWAAGYGKQQLRSYALKRMLVHLDDASMDGIARSLSQKKRGNLGYLNVCFRAFYRRPILIVKALRLFAG